MKLTNLLLAAVVGMGLAGPSAAAPVTFFGENLTPGATVSGDPATAQSSFLATLSGVGTEDFESIANGTSNPSLTFPGSSGNITATLSGSGFVDPSPGAGRFATSGSNFFETEAGGNFSISFSSAISAFGFFGTDIGDFNNALSLELTKSGGGTETLNVGNTVGANNGSLLFFGFVDTAESYTSIAFNNDPGGTDVFGFDDMTIGDAGQIINPPVIPLPAGLPLLLTGLGAIGGVGALRRRKIKAAA